MFNINFLIPFICFSLSCALLICGRRRHRLEGNEEIAGGYSAFSLISHVAAIVCLILILIKIGFIAFLSYLGIFVGTNIIGFVLFAMPAWRHLDCEGCLPPLISIGTAIWTYVELFQIY